jgi:hypothetical protein
MMLARFWVYQFDHGWLAMKAPLGSVHPWIRFYHAWRGVASDESAAIAVAKERAMRSA